METLFLPGSSPPISPFSDESREQRRPSPRGRAVSPGGEEEDERKRGSLKAAPRRPPPYPLPPSASATGSCVPEAAEESKGTRSGGRPEQEQFPKSSCASANGGEGAVARWSRRSQPNEVEFSLSLGIDGDEGDEGRREVAEAVVPRVSPDSVGTACLPVAVNGCGEAAAVAVEGAGIFSLSALLLFLQREQRRPWTRRLPSTGALPRRSRGG